MKAATIAQLKKELQFKSQEETLLLCLRLARFKKENKELLTYLLFESDSEEGYIESVKEEVDAMFEDINTSSYFYIKKSVILWQTRSGRIWIILFYIVYVFL